MEQAELYEAVVKYGGIRPAGRALGIPENTIRRKLKGFQPPLPDYAYVPGEEALPPTHIGEQGVPTVDYVPVSPAVRRFIFTSAQNNARVHQGFWKNLLAFGQHMNADVMVGFTVYDKAGYRGVVANKGERELRQKDIWWDKAVEPYTCGHRARLHKRLAFCGELDIIATARNPLGGLDSYCGRSSIIVPHNTFAFRCVESRREQMPKEMYTTGSCTLPRFVQRKTGQIAAFHHVIGALLVEITAEGFWHVHHLNAETDGSFYWLDKRVSKGRVTANKQGIEGLVLGDIHHEKIDATQASAAHGILKDLKPRHVFVHDLIDFRSRNHHNRQDPFFRAGVTGVKVEDELCAAGRFLDNIIENVPTGQVYVVESNHHEALVRWLKETDWREDADNAAFYLLLAREIVVAAAAGTYVNGLRWALQDYLGYADKAEFLEMDQSVEVAGVECGIHGHVGPSGTRGNPRAFSRLGFKTFTAHTHSPSIVDGCYTVGVMGKLDMGYNRGPSKWMHCHGIIYPNGKRAFLFVKNEKWRA